VKTRVQDQSRQVIKELPFKKNTMKRLILFIVITGLLSCNSHKSSSAPTDPTTDKTEGADKKENTDPKDGGTTDPGKSNTENPPAPGNGEKPQTPEPNPQPGTPTPTTPTVPYSPNKEGLNDTASENQGRKLNPGTGGKVVSTVYPNQKGGLNDTASEAPKPNRAARRQKPN
jgi:cytoskeletal protein RodZ